MKVYYDKRQSVGVNNSISPSAGKPAKVLASWQNLGIPFDVCSFDPLTVEEISLAHDRKYVEGVLACTRENGFMNKSRSVAKALPWVCGSMAAAALHSFRTGEFSFSPTSGAHHAGYSSASGFCTFNFLVIAAILAHEAGAKTIGILDLDCHYGNGTDDIIKHLGLSYIQHYTFGKLNIESGSSAIKWLLGLPDEVSRFEGVDLLIYNAGVDPHIDDPLGGVLTTNQMKLRDYFVFKGAKKLGLSVCASLAGGYQSEFDGSIDKVLRLHDNTFIAAWEAFGRNP